MSEKKYKVQTEDVAVPEIHTGEQPQNNEDERDKKEVVYEPLAVPEVHIHRKNKH